MHENHYYQSQHGNITEPRSSSGFLVAPYSAKCGTNAHENETDIVPNGNDEMVECYSDMTAVNGSLKVKNALNPRGTKICKSAKSSMKVVGEQPCITVVGEQLCSEKERKGLIEDESSRSSGLLLLSIPCRFWFS